MKLIHSLVISGCLIMGFAFAGSIDAPKIPASFEKNIGQKHEQVVFSSKGAGFTAYLTNNGMVFDYSKYVSEHIDADTPLNPNDQIKSNEILHDVLRMGFVDSSPLMAIEGINELEQKSNYFIGNDSSKWYTDVPHYSEIRYINVYDGIDLKMYSLDNKLEYDFLVSPGADPSQIKMNYEGAKNLSLDDQGNLIVEMEYQTIIHKAPVLYQENGNVKNKISGKYVLEEGNLIRFAIDSYDAEKALVIDPIIGYSTFFGGTDYDSFNNIEVTSHGITVVGLTRSTDFPLENNIMTHQAFEDIAIVRLSSDGTLVLFSTYIGGSNTDQSYFNHGLEIDNTGAIYITGDANSNDFPVTANAYDKVNPGLALVKLNNLGNAIEFATYLGNIDTGKGAGLALDASNNPIISGTVVTVGPPPFGISVNKSAIGVIGTGVVFKLNSNASAILWTKDVETINGNDIEFKELSLASNGDIVVAGRASVVGIITKDNLQNKAALAPGQHAFVYRLSADGSTVLNSIDIPTDNETTPYEVKVGNDHQIYLLGTTTATNYPTTAGALMGDQAGIDMFISKFSSDLSTILYSTYYGGNADDFTYSFDVDQGIITVSGHTYSNDLLLTGDALFSKKSCFRCVTKKGVIFRLNSNNGDFLYGTHYGVSHENRFLGTFVDDRGNIWACGQSNSNVFPIVGGAVQPVLAGDFDATLVKLIMNDPPTVSVSGDISGVIGEELNFAATASDDIDTPRLFWNYGDNSTSSSHEYGTSSNTSHVFTQAGSFYVTIFATDGDGQQATDRVKVEIESLAKDDPLRNAHGVWINDTDLLLAWEGGNSSEVDLQKYNVYQNTTVKSSATFIGSTTDTEMVVYGLDRSLDYTFEIQAIFPGETIGDSISITVTASKSTKSVLPNRLLFPHIAQNEQWWTGIVFINPNETAETVELQAMNSAGKRIGLKSNQVILAAGEKSMGLISDYYSADQIAEISWLQLLSTNKLIGFELFGQGMSNMSGVAVNGKRYYRGYLPVAKANEAQYVGLSLINDSADQSAMVTFTGYNLSGNAVASAQVEIAPYAKTAKIIEDIFAANWVDSIATVGWQSNNPLTGFELWGDKENWTTQQGIGISRYGNLSQTLPLINSKSLVVYQNSAQVENTVVFKGYDASGLLVATKTITLLPKEKYQATGTEMFGSIFKGTVKINSNATGYALCEVTNENGDGELAEAFASMTEGGGKLLFPHIASNAQWTTEIEIINTTDRNETISITAYDLKGNMVDQVNDISVAANGSYHKKARELFADTSEIAYLKTTASAKVFSGNLMYYTNDGFGHLMAGVKATVLD